MTKLAPSVAGILFVSAIAAGTACSSSTEATAGPGGATSTQINSCKSSCDKMKVFDCNSAAEQARCYDECNGATPDQIRLFTGCAQSSICDPECRTTIAPAKSSASSTGGSTTTTTGGGGATPDSCTTACEKIVSCNFIPVGKKAECVSSCQSQGYQYQIDCVNKTACDKMASTCGNVGGGGSTVIVEPRGDGGTTTGGGSDDFDIKVCQSDCDSLQFFDCLTASELTTCRKQCSTAKADVRDTFSSCSKGAGSTCTKGQDCFKEFTK